MVDTVGGLGADVFIDLTEPNSIPADAPFLIRYTDSKRSRRILIIGILGSLACVALLSGLYFATADPSAEVGWLFPSLVVLLPAAFVVYLTAVHGSVVGKLTLHEDRLEFRPSTPAAPGTKHVVYAWDRIDGWRWDEGPGRTWVVLRFGRDRNAVILQLAGFDADESRRFKDQWTTVAGTPGSPESESPGAARFKRIAGWSLLLIFLGIAGVMIGSGEMDRDSWLRLAFLCPAVLPAAIRLIQSGRAG